MPKISAYPSGGAPQSTDNFIIERSGQNYKVLWSGLIPRVVSLLVSSPAAILATGDEQVYYRIPSVLNGWNLTAVAAHVSTASTGAAPTIQIRNVTDAVDMLSTPITIDANEKDSLTAATPAVIDTTKDDVATGDELAVDVDVAGTGTKGLSVEMTFSLP